MKYRTIIIMIILVSFISFAYSDFPYEIHPWWVVDPNNCPESFMSQDCPTGNVCGVRLNGINYCKDVSGYESPTYESIPWISEYDMSGGYIFDCLNVQYLGSPCGPWSCNINKSCDGMNIGTICNGAGSSYCSHCYSGYLDCNNDTQDGCEIKDEAECITEEGKPGIYRGCSNGKGNCLDIEEDMLWVDWPSDCPDILNENSCAPGLSVCGTDNPSKPSAGNPYCTDLTPWATPYRYEPSVSISQLSPGYVIDCLNSYDFNYCKNLYCNKAETCEGRNQKTLCKTYSQWGGAAWECADCKKGYLDCNGNQIDGCEILNGSYCQTEEGIDGIYNGCENGKGKCEIEDKTRIWVKNPEDCPTSYMSQDCATGNLCGFKGGIVFCENPIKIPVPTISSSSNQWYNPSLNPGYMIDCLDSDGSAPYCDTWYCNADSTCFNKKMLTVCESTNSTYCEGCMHDYFDCNLDESDGCEVHEGDSCLTEGGFSGYYQGCSCIGNHCNNGQEDGDETDVDCGGSCETCENGKECNSDGDCESGYCEGGVCKEPSCEDNILNGDEEGVDCGGSCEKCEPKCIPLEINGNSENKIDLVFIPEKDYEGNLSLFLEHVNDKIINLSNTDVIENYTDEFNFYYSKEEGSIIDKSFFGLFERTEINLPGGIDFFKKCSLADAIIILHSSERDDFTRENIYTAEGNYTKAFLHETGHGVFGLADQYDDQSRNCKTHYFQSDKYPNIWNSSQECIEDGNETGKWDEDECFQFTTCQNGFWMMDRSLRLIMYGGFSTDKFDKASELRVRWVFNETRKGNRPNGSYGVGYELGQSPKSVVATFNLQNDSLTFLEAEIVDGYSPNHLSQTLEYIINITDISGNLIEVYSIPNPSIVFYENGSSNSSRDINFTTIFPYYNRMHEMTILDKEDSGIKSKVNLSKINEDFCAVNPQDLDCPATFNLTIKKGWNLISIPLLLENMSVISIFEQLGEYFIYGYNERWIEPSELNNQQSYWLFANYSYNLSIWGIRIPNSFIVNEGFIGYPSLNNSNIRNYENNENFSIFSYTKPEDKWITYDSRKENNSLELFEPGKGYWIKKEII